MPVTSRSLQIRKVYGNGKGSPNYRYDPISKSAVLSGCGCSIPKFQCIPPSIIDGGSYATTSSTIIDGQYPDTTVFNCVIDGGELL